MSIITSYNNGKYAPSRGRTSQCASRGCNGEVVRHSLGCGMAIGRCTRCFARYELSLSEAPRQTETRRSALSRLIHEFVTWREDV